MDDLGSGTVQEIDDHDLILPGYVPYLSLVFKVVATAAILLLSGWVVYTIKTTRNLHKPHNIYVANLLLAGVMATLHLCIIPSIMMISFQLGVESFVSCYALQFQYLPFHVNNMSFVIIAADKVIAITSPFKYKRMMTSRVLAVVIGGAWLLATIVTICYVIHVSEGVEVLEYGTCILEENSFSGFFLTVILPMMLSAIVMVILNAYLTIKAYLIHKQIEGETALSGQSESVTSLKEKQHNTRKNKKPITTLLVVVLGSVFINLAIAVLYPIGRWWITSPTYHHFMEYVFVPNIGLVVRFLPPLVYGLYFKQVRKPMIKCLQRFVGMNKVNAVAPQPRKTAWM